MNVLETKGMVLFEWEKRIYDDGNWSWKIRQKVGVKYCMNLIYDLQGSFSNLVCMYSQMVTLATCKFASKQ